ncbi:hypothetical protein C5S30_06975 [ANME-1 cluster archaeon GoMg4]|nr:hypothetical protein [ANME-1 cluster archaeon GoMg4]
MPHERYIGKLAFFLLNLGVYPLYIAPRSPWNNGQVEGFNSVFSNNPELKEKDIKHIDDFKDVNLENKCVKHFKADKIYFLRIVRRKNDKGSDNEYGFIDILKHEIKLPQDLINLFVFCVLILNQSFLRLISSWMMGL